MPKQNWLTTHCISYFIYKLKKTEVLYSYVLLAESKDCSLLNFIFLYNDLKTIWQILPMKYWVIIPYIILSE